MKSSLLSLCLTTTFVAAVNGAAAPGLRTTNYTNIFSNEAGYPVSGSGYEVATIPGVWDALNWQNIGIAFFCDAVCAIEPVTEISQGQFAGSNMNPAVVSAAYNGSKVLFFDMKDTYFGCAAQFNDTLYDETVYAPANCSVTFKGYRGDHYQIEPAVASVTFDYVPSIFTNYEGGPDAIQQHYTFPSTFTGLRTLTMQLSHYNNKYYLSRPDVYTDNISYRVTNITV